MSEYLTDPQWIVITGTAIIFALIYGLQKRRPNEHQERKKVETILKSFGDDYTLYRNIVIPAQGGMSHIDYILASPYGMFVINVKMEAGTIVGNVNAREWRVGKRNTIYNPLWRNRTHMNGLENQLGKLPMESLVVFPCAKLTGKIGPGVLVPNQIIGFIKAHGEMRISSDQLRFVKEILRPIQTER